MRAYVYRDCDARLRLRKVVVEIYDDGANADEHLPRDRTRMFAWPFLARRLARRVARMKARCEVMKNAST